MKDKRPLGLRLSGAKKLLEANGYTVQQPRPAPRIGDIFHFAEEDMFVLIVWHDPTARPNEHGHFMWGGVEVGDKNYTDGLWIDHETWRKDPNAYVLKGHIDLTKALKD